MNLYVYEHCPFCIRARMIFGLKHIDFNLKIIMEADVETPTKMIGKKMVPILEKDDGTYMGESLDIVHYVDQTGDPILTAPQDKDIANWEQEHQSTIFNLAVPRFTKADFKELATDEAREYFRKREEKSFGDLEALIAKSSSLIADIESGLKTLEPMISKRGKDNFDISDITLYPLLWSLSIVDGVDFPKDVQDYMYRVSSASMIPLLFKQKM